VRVLALDIGDSRVGIALSDADGRVAMPRDVIEASTLRGDFREIVRLVEETQSELVLVGLPLSMDGSEGPQAERVREVSERMAQFLPVPVRYADERLSSAQARRIAEESGVDSRGQRGQLDAVAASVFLQTWLDARAERGRTDDER